MTVCYSLHKKTKIWREGLCKGHLSGYRSAQREVQATLLQCTVKSKVRVLFRKTKSLKLKQRCSNKAAETLVRSEEMVSVVASRQCILIVASGSSSNLSSLWLRYACALHVNFIFYCTSVVSSPRHWQSTRTPGRSGSVAVCVVRLFENYKIRLIILYVVFL